jgi:hypothetical protein
MQPILDDCSLPALHMPAEWSQIHLEEKSWLVGSDKPGKTSAFASRGLAPFRGELREKPTFAPTAEEKKAGFG